MASIRRSLVLSFASSYTGLLITVPTVMVMARFLTPKETGIFSVGLAVLNLAHMFRDFGVAGYLIQERNLTRVKIRAAFTITLLMAWIIAAVLVVAAPPLSHFYEEPGVKSVVWVLALSFVVMPFSAPATALLRRDLAYGPLYVIQTSSALVRSMASVVMVIVGFSYMSLAWGAFAGMVATAIGTAIYRPRETFVCPTLREWRGVFSFGSKKTCIDILKRLGTDANSLVIGRMLGLGAAGLFSRGAGLINLFNGKFHGAISSVAFPAFAGHSRDGKDVNALFSKSMAYVTGVAWPFYAFASIMAYPIILAAYGPQWVQAVPVLRLLAIAAAVGCLSLYTGQLLMATGHINSFLHVQVVVQPMRVGLIIVGSFYSIEAVAAAQIAGSALGVVLQYRELGKHLGIQLPKILRATAPSVAVAALAVVVPLATTVIDFGGAVPGPWVRLIIGVAGGAGGWLVGIAMFNHPLREEIFSAWSRFSAHLSLRRSTSHG